MNEGIPNRILIYRADEYAFDVIPAPSTAFTSVLVNDLNLELDAHGHVISVWGLSPHTSWKRANLKPPVADFLNVTFVADGSLNRGVSVRLNKGKYWPVFVDPTSGWVCVKGDDRATMAAKIMSGIIGSVLLGQHQLPDLH